MDILRKTETLPDAYPELPSGFLSDIEAAIEPELVWGRIEPYISYRWTPRSVVWVVTGPGDFVPDLRPYTIDTVERWEDEVWVADTTLTTTPLGGLQLRRGLTYRVTCTVGDVSPADVPRPVLEAYRRLAGYFAETNEKPGSSSYRVSLSSITEEYDRAPTWLARAMQYSGAGDLLRKYRRG